MDIEKTLADILVKAPHLPYAQCEENEGKHLVIAYCNQKETQCERFNAAYECITLWDKLVNILTTSCLPACIQIGNTLFQPCYLERIVLFADERAYFVTLDFGADRNMAFGYKTRAAQNEMYQNLLTLLGEPVEKADQLNPPIH
jgi:hypothetical protein